MRNRLLNRKVTCKVDVFSEYSVMPRIIIRNAYQQVSAFGRDRDVAYEECWLSLRDMCIKVIEIQLLPCEYGINEGLRITMNGLQDLISIPCIMSNSTDISRSRPFKTVRPQCGPLNCKWTSLQRAQNALMQCDDVSVAWTVSTAAIAASSIDNAT